MALLIALGIGLITAAVVWFYVVPRQRKVILAKLGIKSHYFLQICGHLKCIAENPSPRLIKKAEPNLENETNEKKSSLESTQVLFTHLLSLQTSFQFLDNCLGIKSKQ